MRLKQSVNSCWLTKHFGLSPSSAYIPPPRFQAPLLKTKYYFRIYVPLPGDKPQSIYYVVLKFN